jgi:hypothetical protein
MNTCAWPLTITEKCEAVTSIAGSPAREPSAAATTGARDRLATEYSQPGTFGT